MTELSVYILTVLYKCRDLPGKKASELKLIFPSYFTCEFNNREIVMECSKLIRLKWLDYHYSNNMGRDSVRQYYITGSGQHVILSYVENLRDIIMS